MQLQLEDLFPELDRLQSLYGDRDSLPVYGAGCISRPRMVLIFINPTARNISSRPSWSGMRAPWLGTKNIWKLFFRLKLIGPEDFRHTQTLPSDGWPEAFARRLYRRISENGVYVTNLAKCTQIDARPLPDKIFRAYMESMHREIISLHPDKIIAFGGQVSSLILGKKIKVSTLAGSVEDLVIDNIHFAFHPVWYPVGQGMRNMDKSFKLLRRLLRSENSL